VTITQSLDLTRAPVPADQGPAVIQLPASVGSDQSTGLSTTNCQANDTADGISTPQSVIEVCAAGAGGSNTTGVAVSINRITVQGNWPNSVCYGSLYDILVGGGASVTLANSIVEQAGAYPLNGCQGGVGVQVGFAPTSQIGHAKMTNDVVETYQKNGITVDGSGSTATISNSTVTGAGPTTQIAQNGIQYSFGATGKVTGSDISGNNYTGTGEASSTGILVFGGGGSTCGIGANSPLVKHASFRKNTLDGNDIGIAFFNVNSACTKSASTPTKDTACHNTIANTHGYPGGVPSADANISGFGSDVGYQAGVSDAGNKDVICDNKISGAGYAPRDKTSSLPNPPPPAFVRPIDIVSEPAIAPSVSGNTYDGKAYHPSVPLIGAGPRTGGRLKERAA
jgi:hypothetical protein